MKFLILPEAKAVRAKQITVAKASLKRMLLEKSALVDEIPVASAFTLMRFKPYCHSKTVSEG